MQYFFRFIVPVFSTVLLLLPLSASAHATPIQYMPEASAVLSQAPSNISIIFSEHIEPRASSITIFRPDSSKLGGVQAEVDPNDSRVLKIPFPSQDKGAFTVSWQVVSADDGHFTQGAYVFSVGTASAVSGASAGQFQIIHSSPLPESFAIGLELFGEAMLFACLVIFSALWRPLRRYFPDETREYRAVFEKRFNFLILFSLLLVVGGGVFYFIFKTNELMTEMGNPAFLFVFKNFAATVSARFTLYRLILALFFLACFWVQKKALFARKSISKAELLLYGTLVLAAFARARVSHAAASAFLPHVSVFINFVHLLFKDLWTGGLAAALFLFAPFFRNTKWVAPKALLLTALSKIITVSIAIGGAAGAYIVWLHLKGPENLLTTMWGKEFIVLSLFAGILLAFRLYHIFVMEPALLRLVQGNAHKKDAQTLSNLPLTFTTETVTGIALLFVTALLIITTPPPTKPDRFTQTQTSQNVAIILEEHPYENGTMLVSAKDAKTGNPIETKHIVATATNEEKGIGPIVLAPEKRFKGGYVFPESLLSPPGAWNVSITMPRDGAYDATGKFMFNYAGDFSQNKTGETRAFDSFAAANITVALGIILFALFLYRLERRRNLLIIEHGKHTGDSAPLSLYARGMWLFPALIAGAILHVTGGGASSHSGFLATAFERQCQKDGFMWHESVPARNGKALSAYAVPGCMVGHSGQFHFADVREYQYFTRPAEAQAKFSASPAHIEPGKPAELTFAIKDFEGKPVPELALEHDRILHVIIIKKDFSTFTHIHPEDLGPVTEDMLKKAEFKTTYTFPKPGTYLVAADYTVRSHTFSDRFFATATNGSSRPEEKPQTDFSRVKDFDGYRVTFALPETPHAKENLVMHFTIEKNEEPVTDMIPYLSVPMHLAIVREDMGEFIHTHGRMPLSLWDEIMSTPPSHIGTLNSFGPFIDADIKFPNAGVYHIFGEFKHQGKVILTHFAVEVK